MVECCGGNRTRIHDPSDWEPVPTPTATPGSRVKLLEETGRHVVDLAAKLQKLQQETQSLHERQTAMDEMLSKLGEQLSKMGEQPSTRSVEAKSLLWQDGFISRVAQLETKFAAAVEGLQDRLTRCEGLQDRLTRCEQKCEKQSPAMQQESSERDLGNDIENALISLQTRMTDCERKLQEERASGDILSLVEPSSDDRNAKLGEEAAVVSPNSKVPSKSAVDKTATLQREASVKISCYTFKMSAWDLAMFSGLPRVGALASAWMLLVTMSNLVMQIILCGLINDYFTGHDYDSATVQDMHNWRIKSAHSWAYADPWTYQSLADRICKRDGSIPVSGTVATILNDVSTYLPNKEDFDALNPALGPFMPEIELVGPLMCTLSIIIWLLMIFQDIDEIVCCVQALWNLPASDDRTSHIEATEDELIWTRICLGRKVWCVIIQCVKAFVATVLASSGTFFLSFTLDIKDLLLNAIALQIVLDLDDIMAAALAPVQAAALVRLLQPLPTMQEYTISGLNLQPVVSFVTLVAVTIAVYAKVLTPQNTLLQNVRNEICQGNKEFLAVRDLAGVVYATDVQDFSYNENANEYTFSALAELVKDKQAIRDDVREGSKSARPSGVSDGRWSLKEVPHLHLDILGDNWNKYCIDIVSPDGVTMYGSLYVNFFKAFLEEKATTGYSLHDCSGARAFCNADNIIGVRLRQVCPKTCGCTFRGSFQIIQSGDKGNGCPAVCQQTNEFKTSEDKRLCIDEAVNGSLLANYIEGLETYSEAFPKQWNKTDILVMIGRLRSMGCKAVTTPLRPGEMHYAWDNMCVRSVNWLALQPMPYVCPQSCNCSASNLEYCPKSCS